MDSFEEVVEKTMASLSVLTLNRLKDGEFSAADICATIDNLHTIEDGLRTQLERIEAACEDAGGADNKGDLNKSQKIKFDLENLDLSDVKPGWDQEKT